MELALHTSYDPEGLDEARRLGLEAIQLRLGHGFPRRGTSGTSPLGETSGTFPLWGPKGLTPEQARGIAQDIERRALRVVALGYYRNLLAPDPDERRREIAGLRRVMTLAAIFGTDLIGVFAGRDPERTIDDNLPAFARVWRPLAEEAHDLGLRLAFENCTMFKGYPVRGINLCHTPYAYQRMFELLDAPNLGIELDLSHLWKQRIDPVGFIHRFAGRIFHFHAKDHELLPDEIEDHGSFDPRTSRDRLPGEGEIDFTAVFAALRATGYRGDVTLEVEPQSVPEDPSSRQRAMARAVDYLRDLIKTHAP